MDAFDSRINLTLGGTADQIEPANMLEKVDVEFAGYLCHRARIRIIAHEEINC
jgi:hypothetical protein